MCLSISVGGGGNSPTDDFYSKLGIFWHAGVNGMRSWDAVWQDAGYNPNDRNTEYLITITRGAFTAGGGGGILIIAFDACGCA